MIALGLILVGVVYQEKVLVIVGYVFGFPFLLVPLIALSQWSEERKKHRDESRSKGSDRS